MAKARKLTVTELRKLIEAEVKSAEKAKESPWHDAELEKEIEWLKALKIKEFFVRGSDKQ